MKRFNDRIDIEILPISYTIVTFAKLDRLTEDDILQISSELSFFQKNIVDVSRFYITYERLRLGRELLSTKKWRGRSNKDNFVYSRLPEVYVSLEMWPASIVKIGNVEFIVRKNNRLLNYSVMFCKLGFFITIPKRTGFG